MKKGISLIVLVITIIVLAILAGAVIISLSNTNVVEQANDAKTKADLANAKSTVQLEYAAAVARGQKAGKVDGKAYNSDASAVMKDTDYTAALTKAGFTATYTVTVEDGVPTKVELAQQ